MLESARMLWKSTEYSVTVSPCSVHWISIHQQVCACCHYCLKHFQKHPRSDHSMSCVVKLGCKSPWIDVSRWKIGCVQKWLEIFREDWVCSELRNIAVRSGQSWAAFRLLTWQYRLLRFSWQEDLQDLFEPGVIPSYCEPCYFGLAWGSHRATAIYW